MSKKIELSSLRANDAVLEIALRDGICVGKIKTADDIAAELAGSERTGGRDALAMKIIADMDVNDIREFPRSPDRRLRLAYDAADALLHEFGAAVRGYSPRGRIKKAWFSSWRRMFTKPVIYAYLLSEGRPAPQTPSVSVSGGVEKTFMQTESKRAEADSAAVKILAMLSADENLRTQDILIMTPNPKRDAPFLRAALEYAGIAFHEEGIPGGCEDADTLLKILRASRSRLTLDFVFDILENRRVAANFGLEASEIGMARGVFESVGVSWGLAGDSRMTFEAAMKVVKESGQEEIIAAASKVFSLAEKISAFSEYVPANMEQAAGAIAGLIETMFGRANGEDITEVRRASASFRSKARHWPDIEMNAPAMVFLAEQIFSGISGRSFAGAGGVTVAPLQSPPRCKAVLLFGMDAGSFPRKRHVPSFASGWMTEWHEEDFCFLEDAAANAEHVVITSHGHVSKMVRSFLKQEAGNQKFEDGNQTSDFKLQASAEAVSQKFEDGNQTSSFKLQTSAVSLSIDLEQLVSFFKNPSRFFLERGKNASLRTGRIYSSREKTVLNSLDSYKLRESVFELLMADTQAEDMRSAVKPLLPSGDAGLSAFEEAFQQAESLYKRVKRRGNKKEVAVNAVSHTNNPAGTNLTGAIEIVGGAQIIARPANLSPKDIAAAVIRHWAANSATGGIETELHGLDGVRVFAPMDKTEAMNLVIFLLHAFKEGLDAPLPFFPETSFAFAQAMAKKDADEQEALKKARAAWVGGDYRRGDKEDPYVSVCFPSFPGDGGNRKLFVYYANAIFVRFL